MLETRLQHLRDLFEDKEAIYIEKGAVHVKVSNIRIGRVSLPQRVASTAPNPVTVLADVDVIPTPSFPTGRFCERPSLVHWEIGAGDETRVSENTWRTGAGYICWSLFFAPRIVQGVLNLAQQFPDALDAHRRYKEIWRYLYDHDAFEPTEALGADPLTTGLLQRILYRVKELLL
jgi:hypothetical protein